MKYAFTDYFNNLFWLSNSTINLARERYIWSLESFVSLEEIRLVKVKSGYYSKQSSDNVTELINMNQIREVTRTEHFS